ncbi:cytoplasmic phosphatidylinositol transfer protein 1b [Polypterus senegalus]|uniref:cytoplasmic phosphatidylinositol transfer protein 1b n=1 Tax=Polypterus senegalus TaxID=55291 RepID=UPI0019625E3C|nr:cytoplasmic phosphatidylinositol transfer protein 1b [Polypterus senegalus]
MLLKEYRICMPLTVDEYRIGQLYMISKHSMEESSGGEGIEVIHNEPHQDPVHGTGQYTEKRIYISSKLPAWVRSFVPKIFYITEKAWNYYPFTVTEYTCSFLPKFHIQIETKFESNRGDNANVFQDKPTPSSDVVSLDIAFDEVPERQYKECEDLRTFHSVKTGRGPLQKDWQETTEPIMCSYKRVKAAFEVYGFQGRVENFVHKNIKDILLTGHRQAVAWIDEWFDMSLEDVRTFEKDLQQKTNSKVKSQSKSEVDGAHPKPGILKRSMSVTDEASLKKMGVPTPPSPSTDNPPCAAPSHPLRLNSTPE